MQILENKNQPTLRAVHHLFSKGKFSDALIVLEGLVKKFPEFGLYRTKLEQCKQELKNLEQHQRLQYTQSISLEKRQSKNDSHKEKFARGLACIAAGRSFDARSIFSEIYDSSGKSDLLALIELTKIDLIDHRHSDALKKAKTGIQADPSCREFYKLAEQAAIELEKFDEANSYFLSQPPVDNPIEPRKRGKNPALPANFKIPPIIGAGNDYRHILERASIFQAEKKPYTKTVSIIVPVYNRQQILANTLAALTHQTYPKELIQIVVVDDGSSDAVIEVVKKYEQKLNIYYIRQADRGYRLAAARNLGIKCANSDAIIFMDADILPLPEDVESYMRVLHVTDNAVLIGHRRYVDVSKISDDEILNDINVAIKLPNINPNNDVADRQNAEGISIDWRFPVYEKSNFLLNDMWPFTKAAGGNIAFSRTLITAAGYVDEDFQAWGCEDGEHGYRLYNAGAYFIPMMNIVSLHQEPLDEIAATPTPVGESFRAIGHKITKEIFARKCPAPIVRKYSPGAVFDVPKVSIYIPAYNAAEYIVQTVQSCLNQNFGDLEVCICDDGSTDDTLLKLEEAFSGNPKVRWISQVNGGIGHATNTAINFCRGMYIGQLDADDMLKQNAVRTCVTFLDKTDVDAVYTDCDYINRDGKHIRDAWCGGEYSSEWMATGMIATHFRMFRKRVWARTVGCDEKIKNAVDLDLWLKISEKGNIAHIHEVLYSYRWHGENTSIKHRKQQEKNHLKVVCHSLKRRDVSQFWQVKSTENPLNPREFKILPEANNKPATPNDVIFLIPTCEKYNKKADSIRATWGKDLTAFGFRYYFLMGNPDISIAQIMGDTLYVPCKDDYESLLAKLVLGYEFLYRNFAFTHIYKIDDDCYPSLKKLINDILPQLANSQYLGGATHSKGSKMNNRWHFGKCSDSRFDQPYKFEIAPFDYAKGGYGYFLRKDVLPFLFEQIAELKNELNVGIYSYEDVRIAEILMTYEIKPKLLEKYNVSKFSENMSNSPYLIYDISDPSVFGILKQNFDGENHG
jgi:chondroitin synthase